MSPIQAVAFELIGTWIKNNPALQPFVAKAEPIAVEIIELSPTEASEAMMRMTMELRDIEMPEEGRAAISFGVEAIGDLGNVELKRAWEAWVMGLMRAAIEHFRAVTIREENSD